MHFMGFQECLCVYKCVWENVCASVCLWGEGKKRDNCMRPFCQLRCRERGGTKEGGRSIIPGGYPRKHFG